MKHGAHRILPSMALAALLVSGCAGGAAKPVVAPTAAAPTAAKTRGAEPATLRGPDAGCQVDNCDPKNSAEH
ncbi:hypothetical protein [Polyangium sp. 6x1]|uniref:hypothetical protein n=1 Tax=Polyangium sp. 6x1 TaxID=3042689 RepID=UPI0024823DCC|nr:hypothetical protein [Polyangium sp. 6x1]MDI1449901.1 hypothetical protein [Polyangium sp. 6x1]